MAPVFVNTPKEGKLSLSLSLSFSLSLFLSLDESSFFILIDLTPDIRTGSYKTCMMAPEQRKNRVESFKDKTHQIREKNEMQTDSAVSDRQAGRLSPTYQGSHALRTAIKLKHLKLRYPQFPHWSSFA
jgi:hypothetical protein